MRVCMCVYDIPKYVWMCAYIYIILFCIFAHMEMPYIAAKMQACSCSQNRVNGKPALHISWVKPSTFKRVVSCVIQLLC